MITLTLTKSTMVLQWYAVSIGYNNINNNNLIYYYYAVVFMPQASSLKLLAHLTTEVGISPDGESLKINQKAENGVVVGFPI